MVDQPIGGAITHRVSSLGNAWEQFKQINDARLREIEQRAAQPDRAEVVERVMREVERANYRPHEYATVVIDRAILRKIISNALSALPPTRDDGGLVPLKPSEELLWILGQPNFACAGTANGLRAVGQEIPRKAEAEQAAVILWMLNLYLIHGDKWRNAGIDFLEKAAKVAQAKAGAA